MDEKNDIKNTPLNKDLKKLVIISLAIIIFIVVLAIVDSKENFLIKLTEKIVIE